MYRTLLSALVVCLALTACGDKATPDPTEVARLEVARLVDEAVKATVAAMPTPEPQTIEKVVKETVIVEKPVEVTVIVEKPVQMTVIKEVIVTPTPEPEPPTPTPTGEEPIEISDPIVLEGKSSDGGTYVHVFALLTNPNPDRWLPISDITVSVFDAQGNIIGMDSDVISVGPGQEVPFYAAIDIADQTRGNVAVELSPEQMRPLAEWPGAVVDVVQANIVGDRVVGQIKNVGDVDVAQTRVIIVVRDGRGQARAILWVYAGESQPGQTVPFEVQYPSAVLEEPGTDIEVYLYPELAAATF